jgi:hypothetical protein
LRLQGRRALHPPLKQISSCIRLSIGIAGRLECLRATKSITKASALAKLA